MTGRDPGLAPERTMLAWTRTALGLVAVAALMLRFARHGPAPALAAVVAAASLLAAGAIWLHARRRRRDMRLALPATFALRAVATAVAVIALSAAAAVLATLASI